MDKALQKLTYFFVNLLFLGLTVALAWLPLEFNVGQFVVVLICGAQITALAVYFVILTQLAADPSSALFGCAFAIVLEFSHVLAMATGAFGYDPLTWTLLKAVVLSCLFFPMFSKGGK